MDSTGNLHLSKVGSTRVSTAGRCQEREFGIGVLHLDGDSIRIGSIDRLGLVDQILCGRILLRRQRIFGATGEVSRPNRRRRPRNSAYRPLRSTKMGSPSTVHASALKFHQFRCSSNAGNKNIEIGCIRFRPQHAHDIECRHTREPGLPGAISGWGGVTSSCLSQRAENGRSHGCSGSGIIKSFI